MLLFRVKIPIISVIICKCRGVYVNVKRVVMCSYPRKLFGRFSQVSTIKALSEFLYTKEKEIFLGGVKVRISYDDTLGWNFLGLLKIFSIPPQSLNQRSSEVLFLTLPLRILLQLQVLFMCCFYKSLFKSL